MKNNEMNDRLNELIEKTIKSMGARTIKHKELDNLDSAVETIKECVEEDKLIGYVVIGLSNTGDTVQTLVGSDFSVYEMMTQFFETITKEKSSLSRAILEKIKCNLEETKTSEPKDKIDDDDCDEDDMKKETAEKLKKIFSKYFDIDPEDY